MRGDHVPLPLRERLGEGCQVNDNNTTMSNAKNAIARSRQLRHTTTPTESVLLEKLRSRGCGGFKFRRQVAIGPFVVDFVCYETKLIVELDGESHDACVDFDGERTMWLQERGFNVVRFTNEDVREHLEGVWESIRALCMRRTEPFAVTTQDDGNQT